MITTIPPNATSADTINGRAILPYCTNAPPINGPITIPKNPVPFANPKYLPLLLPGIISINKAFTMAPVPAAVEPSIILKNKSWSKVWAWVYSILAIAKPNNPKTMNIFLPILSAQEPMIGENINPAKEKTPINNPNWKSPPPNTFTYNGKTGITILCPVNEINRTNERKIVIRLIWNVVYVSCCSRSSFLVLCNSSITLTHSVEAT